jgi:hypothetical protein
MNTRKVLFNDPFNPECIERLKFLYLYYDEIHVMDYGPYLESFSESNIADEIDKSFDKEVEKIRRECHMREMRDRNFINSRINIARKRSRKIKEEIRPHYSRFFNQQLEYWSYLKRLAGAGFVIMDSKSLNPSSNVRTAMKMDDASVDEIKNMSGALGKGLANWCQTSMIAYAVKNDLPTDLAIMMAAALGPVYAMYVVAGVIKQNDDYEIYTGETEQLKTLSNMARKNPVDTKLAENVIRIEVPTIRHVDIEQLSSVRC